MEIRVNRIIQVLTALFLTALLWLAFGLHSFAATTATTSATVTVNGGERVISSGSNSITLPAVHLSGSQQTSSVDLGNLQVVDASGTGAGWHVTVAANQAKSDSAQKTLDTGLLSIDPVKGVSKVDSTSSNVPNIVTSSSKVVDAGAVTLVSAKSGDGMGSYNASLSKLTLTVPANTYAGDYSTTLTYSLITAP